MPVGRRAGRGTPAEGSFLMPCSEHAGQMRHKEWAPEKVGSTPRFPGGKPRLLPSLGNDEVEPKSLPLLEWSQRQPAKTKGLNNRKMLHIS